MNYYPGGLPAGYAVAASDKPGLYAASPYAASIGASPYATAPGQPGIAAIQAYPRQQYITVSQASPYSPAQAQQAYFASAGYATAGGVPLSSQQMQNAQAQAYLQAQYQGAVQAAMYPTSVAAAGYGGSPLYATSSPYAGLAVAGQPTRSPYGVAAPVGYTTAGLQPGSGAPAGYLGGSAYGPPY
jgi:hypothetical protein